MNYNQNNKTDSIISYVLNIILELEVLTSQYLKSPVTKGYTHFDCKLRVSLQDLNLFLTSFLLILVMSMYTPKHLHHACHFPALSACDVNPLFIMPFLTFSCIPGTLIFFHAAYCFWTTIKTEAARSSELLWSKWLPVFWRTVVSSHSGSRSSRTWGTAYPICGLITMMTWIFSNTTMRNQSHAYLKCCYLFPILQNIVQ